MGKEISETSATEVGGLALWGHRESDGRARRRRVRWQWPRGSAGRFEPGAVEQLLELDDVGPASRRLRLAPGWRSRAPARAHPRRHPRRRRAEHRPRHPTQLPPSAHPRRPRRGCQRLGPPPHQLTQADQEDVGETRSGAPPLARTFAVTPPNSGENRTHGSIGGRWPEVHSEQVGRTRSRGPASPPAASTSNQRPTHWATLSRACRVKNRG